MANILFASNKTTDWVGAVNTTTTAGRFDSTKVPYAIELADNGTLGMASAHNAPVGDTVWYGWQHYNDRAANLGEDGVLATVFDAAGNSVAAIDLLDGNWRAQALGDTVVTGADYTPTAAGAMMVVALQVQVNATNVVVTLYVNGVSVSTATAANAGGKGVARRFEFTLTDAVYLTPDYFSEFIVAESNTTNMRVTRLDPAAAGNYAQWSGNVADLADDNAVTGMSTTAAANRSSATFDALSGGVITAVVGVSLMSADAGAPQNVKQFLRKGTVDYDGATVALSAVNSFAIECWDLDPSTGAAWADAAAVNACEIGLLSVA